MASNDTGAAYRTIERGLQLYPSNLALHWAKARCLLAMKREKEAIEIVTAKFNHDANTFFDPEIAYDKKLFGEDKYGLLGSAWFKLGEYTKAAEYFDQAAQIAENPREFTLKSALSRARFKASEINIQS